MPDASFGIMTTPMQVDCQDVLRAWCEADAIAETEHAWLFDHLMPIGGDPGGPTYEGWTLLSALAAQTERLRLGLLVTSNRFRPPAMLAKIATTVDIVSGGRLDFGIGAGSRPSHSLARREYEAHCLPYDDFEHSVGDLAEAYTVIRRLWTETEPFDFHGDYVQLTGAFGNPKPVQRPHPPILISGRSSGVLRVVAEHADLSNIPGATSTTPPAAAHSWTATAPRSAATPPQSPAPSTSRVLRRTGCHPEGHRRSDRRRLPTHRSRSVRPLPGQRRSVGHRQAHQHLGLWQCGAEVTYRRTGSGQPQPLLPRVQGGRGSALVGLLPVLRYAPPSPPAWCAMIGRTVVEEHR